MVIGGLKLYVNIPKYGRDTLRMESQRLVEKDQYSATRLEDDPLWDFGADITPEYMGDDMVLLLGLTDDKAERMRKEALEGEEAMFYSLEKWSPGLHSGQRLNWVQCWGIPLPALEKTHIQKIVAVFGDLVDVDNDIDAARRVDKARVLIRTPWKPAIQHTIRVYVGEEVYEVQVVEECSQSVEPCHCRRTSVTWSSEEAESDDSSIGTPVSRNRSVPSHDDVDVATMEPPDTAERRRFSSDLIARNDDDVATLEPLNMAERRRFSSDFTVGRDDDATNMEIPNIAERRRPCSGLTNGTAVLPNGLSTWSGPLGNSLNPRVKTQLSTMGTTATGADTGKDKVECQGQGPEAASSIQDWCNKGGAQAIRKEDQTTEDKGIHEKGNIVAAKKGERQSVESTLYPKEGTCCETSEEGENSAVIKADDVAVVQFLNVGESRDVHTHVGMGSRGMGFPIHTPNKHNGASSNSPQPSTNELSSIWRVYSRTRRCQQQPHLGSLNESINDTSSHIKILTRQQQPVRSQDTRGADCSGHISQKECFQIPQQMVNDKNGKSQLEEPADIWNMAQELGATTDIE
ncbi:hypothetical protein GYH30_024635 [Glycine max]|nr:hypothetical protein GYH30_024635 [Glycine max]